MVKETCQKFTTKTTSITPEFTDARLTNYAGLIPISDFLLDKLDFRQVLGKHLDLGMGANCRYEGWQIFGLIVFGYLCGYRRLAHFEQLSRDTTVQKLLGLDGPIDENTLAYRLKKAGYKQSVELGRVSKQLAGRVHCGYEPPQGRWQWIDFDSTVKGAYGRQQGAEPGFNPGKKGQACYHPLLSFDTASKEVLHSWWRPGNTYTGNGAAAFFAETCQRLANPQGDYVVRADSGFFGDPFLSAIEQAGYDYLVKVRLKNLNRLLAGQYWQSVPGQPGTEYCTFTHQCAGWGQSRAFVGIRTVTEVITEGVLFPVYHYQYACYCTSLEEAPIQIHRLYGDRGECENWIEAVKNQLGAGTTLTGQFWANDLLWQLGVLAYNLSVWLRRLTDRASWRQEPRTFREWFIRCAGKLVYHARRWTLNMQASYYKRRKWESIYQQICRLQL
jgi:hypothetical protein